MHSIKNFFIIIKNLNLLKTFYFFFILSLISTILEIISIGSILPLLHLIIDENFFNKYSTYSYILLEISPLKYIDGNYSTHINYISGLSVVILTIFIFRFLFQLFIEWYKFTFIYKLEFLLSNKLFDYFMNSPYQFHLKKNSSSFHRDIQSDIGYFSATANAVVTLLIELLVLVGVVSLILLVQFTSTISAIVILSFFGYIFLRTTSKLNLKLGTKVHEASQKRIKYLIEGFQGIKDIIVFNKIKFFTSNFILFNKKLTEAKKNHSIVSSIPRLILEILLILGFLIILFVLILSDIPIAKSVPILGFFAAASFRLTPSCYKIVNSIQRLKFTDKPINNLKNHVVIANSQVDEEQFQQEIVFENKLSIKNLNFAFDNKEEVIKNLSLEINEGETIGIFGESGSGKSTLINLIMGLFTPNQGNIYSNNNDIFKNPSSWRKNIGYVTQNVFLTDDKLINNIALGIEEKAIDLKKIESSIANSGLLEFVKNLKNGINNYVGEQGSRISGGQLQRVGIARALYNDPKILIFDESTSSLDLKTESEIMTNVYKFQKNKTLIIISHKLDLLKKCDHIYELKNKKLIKK